MNKYYVIKSLDPYLLARLVTELMMEGYYQYILNIETGNPFSGEHKWLAIYWEKDFAFIKRKGIKPDARFILTARNYEKVLSNILK